MLRFRRFIASSGYRYGPSQKAMLVLVLALVSSLLSACASVKSLQVRSVASEEAPLRLVVLPTDERVGLQRRYLPLARYLQEGLGRPTELVVSPDYDSLGALVEQGKAELAWFSGVLYRRSGRRHKVVPIARTTLRGEGTYRGVIVVRADSPIRTLQDLRGCRFAYVDRASGSGFLSPNLTMTRVGLDPLRDLKEVVFTHSHFASLQGILAGRWDAAAVFENIQDAVRGRADVARLRVLVRTDPVPKDVIGCSPALSPELREKIRKLLLALPATERGRQVLAAVAQSNLIDGFVEMTEGP